MKKFVNGCVAFILAVLCVVTFAPKAHSDVDLLLGYYPRAMAVVEVNPETDAVTVEDGMGFQWEFDGVEDWSVGDICAVIMYDNGTPENIFDDEIAMSRYNGTIATPDFVVRAWELMFQVYDD